MVITPSVDVRSFVNMHREQFVGDRGFMRMTRELRKASKNPQNTLGPNVVSAKILENYYGSAANTRLCVSYRSYLRAVTKMEGGEA